MRLKVPKAFPSRYPDAVVACDEPIIEELQGQQMLVNPHQWSKNSSAREWPGRLVKYDHREAA